LIDRKALQDLDFYKILSLIEELSNSEATRKAIKQIFPLENFHEVETSLKEFEELKEFLDRGEDIPISSFPDIYSLIEKATKEGVFFESSELSQFLKVLRILDRLSFVVEAISEFQFLNRKIKSILNIYPPEAFSFASGKCEAFADHKHILEKLENTVDEEGNILDSASSMLKYLRKQIKNTEERIKNKLEEIMNRQDIKLFLQDNFITKRNNRWVIPVRMDSKGQIRGVVHDVSRSGETAFVEPEEVTALSKKLEELQIEERLEEIRILKEISSDIYQISESIKRGFTLLVYIDKLISIYKFALRFNAQVPQITEERKMRILNARHPILMLSKEVVPLDIELKDERVLLITGPNAGGKTITIKTIGLLTAMALSGLPITASSSSLIPFVKSIYVDLYHEGSIEEHLSSFAFHVVTLKKIIEEADSESLVLLDEIGTNTDPEEGSALACAILEELRDREALTFATTHLSKVKLFVATQQGMEIAAMLFDEETMAPLYRLKIGTLIPSYALEVAKKYGFPERLIKRAYERKETQDIKIYELMKELEKTKHEYEEKLKELEKRQKYLIAEKEKIENEKIKFEERNKKIIEQAKQDAQKMLINLRREINFLYEEAKKADRKKLKELSQKLTEISRQFASEETKNPQNIKIDDIVKINPLNLLGKVLSIEDGRVKIQTETAQIEADISEIEKVSFKEINEAPLSVQTVSFNQKFEVNEEVQTKKLDIRGLRLDEAIPFVERFLNELSIRECSKGIIIHGIGKGFLRDLVRDYIKDHPVVKNFRKGNPDEGGDAVTVVELI